MLTQPWDLLADWAARAGELERRSSGLARLLRSLGLRRGDVVAVLLENHVRYLEIAWAAQRSGLYYTAINWRLHPDEIAYILADCGARALITSAAMAEVMAGLAGRTPAVEQVLCLDGELPGARSYEESLRGQSERPFDDPIEGCELLYSSGTTGKPKAVKRPLPPPGHMVPAHEAASALYRTT